DRPPSLPLPRPDSPSPCGGGACARTRAPPAELARARLSSVAPASALPLSTLLSQALVAFTIELDNDFELQMPHVTTMGMKAGRSADGPWLVSFVMWAN